MTTTGIVDMELVSKEVEKDDELQKIIAKLKGNAEKHEKYQWNEGRLLYKGRVVL